MNHDSIMSANNPTEASAIEAGRQRGHVELKAFDYAWKCEK
jgi:hypothetical protein